MYMLISQDRPISQDEPISQVGLVMLVPPLIW
jgi:hypothetical protein